MTVASRIITVSEMNMATISRVQPRIKRQMPTKIVPPIMIGLLRPYLEVLLSASTPTIGCMINPDNGPAIHTSESLLFVKPSCRRYGVQYVISVPQVNLQAIQQSWTSNEDGRAYCNPTRLNVSRAIRIDSDEPLTRAVPSHVAATMIPV